MQRRSSIASLIFISNKTSPQRWKFPFAVKRIGTSNPPQKKHICNARVTYEDWVLCHYVGCNACMEGFNLMDDAGKTCVTASLTADFCTLTHKSTENLAIYEKQNSHIFFWTSLLLCEKHC